MNRPQSPDPDTVRRPGKSPGITLFVFGAVLVILPALGYLDHRSGLEEFRQARIREAVSAQEDLNSLLKALDHDDRESLVEARERIHDQIALIETIRHLLPAQSREELSRQAEILIGKSLDIRQQLEALPADG